MIELTPAQRREFKARAHYLNPVASVASNGLTDAVLAEIDRGLKAHELIKVRVYGEDREQRNAWMEEICRRLDASPVQHIGNVLILYREARPEDKAGPAPEKSAPARSVATMKSAKAFAAAARRRALASAAREKAANPRGIKRPLNRGR